MPHNATNNARTRTEFGRLDAGMFDFPDCRDCRTFREAHHRALADRRTSRDYLLILAGKQQARVWAERLFVAAIDLDTMAETVEALNAENEALRREVDRLTAALAEAKHQ